MRKGACARGRGLGVCGGDVVEGRVYLEYLRDAVSAAMAKGMSLEEMKRTIIPALSSRRCL